MDLLTSRKNHSDNTEIHIGDAVFGNGSLPIIAGPCTIESQSQLNIVAKAVKASGANLLRGGAYKPRTSPYSFHGLGEEGLRLLINAGKATGLPVVSEIMDPSDLPKFEEIDLIQVGAKNMQNYALLTALGKAKQPILLKRGWGNTLEELLYSAEYIMNNGNPNVILCERGIRTFEPSTRNTFDINAIPLLQQLTHLPVIADPSHGTGISSIVVPVTFAAVAAGADGILVEVHNNPEKALCDGSQALDLNGFSQLVLGARRYEEVRYINSPSL